MANTEWTAPDLPDLAGRTIVITGASSGLGAVTARALASAGARIVLAVRDVPKGEVVADSIIGDTAVSQLDLSDLDSVREFADRWTNDIDILINNAGIMAGPLRRTSDGFELQIATNHLGHFLLTNLLLEHITDRVVTVASGLSRIGHIDLDDLSWERRPYQPWRAYGQSKLANLLFTVELQVRLSAADRAVRAIAAHPGVVKTNLDTHLGGVIGATYKVLGPRLLPDVTHGASAILYAATADLPGNSYVGPGSRRRGSPKLQKRSRADTDPDIARRLWDLSAQLTHTPS